MAPAISSSLFFWPNAGWQTAELSKSREKKERTRGITLIFSHAGCAAMSL
jgi:hypothetical protein